MSNQKQHYVCDCMYENVNSFGSVQVMFIAVLQDSKDMNKLFSRGNMISFYMFVCDFNKYLSDSISDLCFHLSLWSHNLFYIQVTSIQHKYAESSICPEKKRCVSCLSTKGLMFYKLF